MLFQQKSFFFKYTVKLQTYLWRESRNTTRLLYFFRSRKERKYITIYRLAEIIILLIQIISICIGKTILRTNPLGIGRKQSDLNRNILRLQHFPFFIGSYNISPFRNRRYINHISFTQYSKRECFTRCQRLIVFSRIHFIVSRTNTFYFQRGINRLLIINWCLIKIDHPIISQGFIPVIRQTECILKISGFHTIFFQFPC